MEQTRLTDAKKVEKLFAIIAFVWIYKIGQYQNLKKSSKLNLIGVENFLYSDMV
jgi:hypothetical protein